MEHKMTVYAFHVGGGEPATIELLCTCGYTSGGSTSIPLDQLNKFAGQHLAAVREKGGSKYEILRGDLRRVTLRPVDEAEDIW